MYKQPPIPPIIEKLLPPAQLSHTIKYAGTYAEAIGRLYRIVSAIPRIGGTANEKEPPAYLHYYTGTVDYYICEFDGEDAMYGKVRFSTEHPAYNGYQKFSLANLKSNQFIQLDFSWVVSKTEYG